jgi:iron complex transport system ATP-binding protein
LVEESGGARGVPRKPGLEPQPAAPALLRAEALGFRIDGREILRGVTLEVRAGEFVGLIGPNGAGKTTLLRLLLGVLKPTAGQVRLAGRPLAEIGVRARAREVAYLSQEEASPFAFPVLDLVLMGRYPHRGRLQRERESDLDKARRALSYVGLSGFEERYFHELSGGEKQLVLFARVLAQEAELLLLDEPTSNLDIRHQDLFFSMALELTREGKAVVACVHDLDVASRYCSRLVLLDRGRVAADGAPAAVLKPEILDPVFETSTLVTANAATGSLSVSVVPRSWPGEGPRVHLIGGAGGAVNLTRELTRLGCRVSGGIAHEFDADHTLWRNLRLPFRVVGAFQRISPQDVEQASFLVEEADLTVLASFPIGPGNLENLRLAARARRLVILASGPEDPPRTFFSEEGRRLFAALSDCAPQMDYAALARELQEGRIPGAVEGVGA